MKGGEEREGGVGREGERKGGEGMEGRRGSVMQVARGWHEVH